MEFPRQEEEDGEAMTGMVKNRQNGAEGRKRILECCKEGSTQYSEMEVICVFPWLSMDLIAAVVVVVEEVGVVQVVIVENYFFTERQHIFGQQCHQRHSQ